MLGESKLAHDCRVTRHEGFRNSPVTLSNEAGRSRHVPRRAGNSGEAVTEHSPTPQGLRRGRIADVPYLTAVEARRSLRRRPRLKSVNRFAAKSDRLLGRLRKLGHQIQQVLLRELFVAELTREKSLPEYYNTTRKIQEFWKLR